MELDDLKHIWQTTQAGVESPHFAEKDLWLMTQQKSQSVIAKLKRNLLLELGLGIAFVPLLGYYIATETSFFRWIALAALGLLGLCVAFYGWGIRRLSAFQEQTSLRMALQQLIEQFEAFIQLYYYTNMVLTPLAFFAGAYWATYLYSYGLQLSLGLSLFFTPIIFGVVRWFVKKAYRQHLERLKTLLYELEDA